MPEASVSFAGNLTDDPTVQLLTVGELLQSLVEWSDNYTVGEVVAAQGIDHGTACHLLWRSSVAGRFPMPTPRAVWPRLPTGVVPNLRISPRPACS